MKYCTNFNFDCTERNADHTCAWYEPCQFQVTGVPQRLTQGFTHVNNGLCECEACRSVQKDGDKLIEQIRNAGSKEELIHAKRHQQQQARLLLWEAEYKDKKKGF